MSTSSSTTNARICRRRRWLHSAACVAILISALAGKAATKKDWHLSDLSTEVTVRPDGTLLVSEALTIPPSSDPNFGLRREIPIGSEDRWDSRYGPGYTRDNGLRVHVFTVAVNGRPAKFRMDQYRRGFYQLIVESTVPGMETATMMPSALAGETNHLNLVYVVSGAVRLLQDRDELYWNVVGHQLPMSFDQVRVRMRLPLGVPPDKVTTIAYAGGRGVSSPRHASDPAIEPETVPDGAAFAIKSLKPYQSIAVVLSWPKGYITPPSAWEKFDLKNVFPPALLLVFYGLLLIYLRRDIHRDSVAARYRPPQGMSPAALRYIQTGGSDGTSLAAALADLTVKGFVRATAKGGRYTFSRLPKCDTDLAALPPEEAELARLLFDPNTNVGGLNVAGNSAQQEMELVALLASASIPTSASPTRANQSITLGPADVRLNVLVGVIQARLRERLQGKYFSWNFGYVALSMLATFLFGINAVAQTASEASSYFLLVWMFFFTQMLTAIIATTLSSARLPDRPSQWLGMLVAMAALIGFPFLVGRQLADDVGWPPIIAISVMMALNAVFTQLLRTPTAAGSELKRQIAGYTMFLQAAEQDQLNRLGKNISAPPQSEALPYAIALGLKEAWGTPWLTPSLPWWRAEAGPMTSETARVEAFSDGVFAIAITLLVLEIKIPKTGDGELAGLLLREWPFYLSFVISFAFIGIMWINHHRLFTHIKRTDNTLLILNLLLLLGVTAVPFPTAVLALNLGQPDQRTAAMLYDGTYLFIAIIFNVLWHYASGGRQHLLHADVDHAAVKQISLQYSFGPVAYLVCFILAWVNVPASLALNILLACFFALPPTAVVRARA